MNYHGMLIFRERLRRNWSQEGLCKGICTVSYLSKIENGKAEPSVEILQLLLERLELRTDSALEAEAARLCEEAYELLFTGRMGDFKQLMATKPAEPYRATAAGLDFLLMPPFAEMGGDALDAGLESCMNARQLALQRILQNRHDEAIALLPNAFCYYWAGLHTYYNGDVTAALQYLQTAYDLAARDGAPHMMLDCKAYMGNCYSMIRDFPRMQEHYAIARRLASALGNESMLHAISYNTASTQLELGMYENAYDYFSKLEAPDKMSLHKLAIACEKTGRLREALAALNDADAITNAAIRSEQAQTMCDVVRFRLQHPDYLSHAAYGEMLLACFDMCRRELPSGYARFHLPWVTEWYAATRQYKRAFELASEFSQ